MLKAKIEDGGAKLVNMKTKNISLKLAWVLRKEEYVLTMFEMFIPEAISTLFWECSLQGSNVPYVIGDKNRINHFYREIIQLWFQFTWESQNSKVETPQDVLNQILLCNSHIRIGGNIIMQKYLINQGVMYVSNIL